MIFNMNGVNYDTDTMRTDGDIINLIKANGAKFEICSYSGTGKYGSSNPNSLTFGFAPRLVQIVGYMSSGRFYTFTEANTTNFQFIEYMDTLTTSYTASRGFHNSSNSISKTYGKKSADGKTIYWYTTDTGGLYTTQLNSSGCTYVCIAVA